MDTNTFNYNGIEIPYMPIEEWNNLDSNVPKFKGQTTVREDNTVVMVWDINSKLYATVCKCFFL